MTPGPEWCIPISLGLLLLFKIYFVPPSKRLLIFMSTWFSLYRNVRGHVDILWCVLVLNVPKGGPDPPRPNLKYLLPWLPNWRWSCPSVTSDSATLPTRCLHTVPCRKMFHNLHNRLRMEGGHFDFVSLGGVNTATVADFKPPTWCH